MCGCNGKPTIGRRRADVVRRWLALVRDRVPVRLADVREEMRRAAAADADDARAAAPSTYAGGGV